MARTRQEQERFGRAPGGQLRPGRRDPANAANAARPQAPRDAGRRDPADRSRLGFLRRWPPVLWVLVYIGSVLILNGSNGKWDPVELAIGIGLALIAFGVGMYLALGPWPGSHPRTREMTWLLSGVALFYGVCALAAALLAGFAEAVATLLAGIIPMTAAALWVATVRGKSHGRPDDPEDRSLEHDEDAFPGIGIDEETPLGDTPEAHDEITPHDLPKDHPGRHAAEQQAGKLGGTTRGHRDGGAAGRGAGNVPPDSGLVGPDEDDEARVRR